MMTTNRLRKRADRAVRCVALSSGGRIFHFRGATYKMYDEIKWGSPLN